MDIIIKTNNCQSPCVYSTHFAAIVVFMADYRHIEYEELVQMLMEYTTAVTKLIGGGINSGPEFQQLNDTLHDIQVELKKRETSQSGSDQVFSPGNSLENSRNS